MRPTRWLFLAALFLSSADGAEGRMDLEAAGDISLQQRGVNLQAIRQLTPKDWSSKLAAKKIEKGAGGPTDCLGPPPSTACQAYLDTFLDNLFREETAPQWPRKLYCSVLDAYWVEWSVDLTERAMVPPDLQAGLPERYTYKSRTANCIPRAHHEGCQKWAKDWDESTGEEVELLWYSLGPCAGESCPCFNDPEPRRRIFYLLGQLDQRLFPRSEKAGSWGKIRQWWRSRAWRR